MARSAGSPPLAHQGPGWGPLLPSGDSGLQALLGALKAGLEEQYVNPRVLPSSSVLAPNHFPPRLIAMTKLSAQVKGSLNVTTPGVQIWRIEVRPAWAWGVGED